jgi:tetratricopeptide (TPR) repeat protein
MAGKVCFVVMGFGRKTDYPTGRVLDLDKSYRTIIRPAVVAAGLECRRADEILHSGPIDVPMYEQLLTADVVIADLSTYNCNAFYELGVRHALRPYTTITIAEDKMVFPFDVNHIAIRRYQHLGEGIDFEEVERMRNELTEAIRIIAAQPANDSPVYEFLNNLTPPAIARPAVALPPAAPAPSPSPAAPNDTVGQLMCLADDAFDSGDFDTAKALLLQARKRLPRQHYIVQKLAVATYKSETPTAQAALDEARALCLELEPDVSTDTETLAVWGSIHKRYWVLTKDPATLDTAIFAYEKGFSLKNDTYNGINYAFLLNIRASLAPGSRESIADTVIAERTRRRVITLCETKLAGKLDDEQAYWTRATLAEAYFGLGDLARSEAYRAEAAALDPPPSPWMLKAAADQLAALATVLPRAMHA